MVTLAEVYNDAVENVKADSSMTFATWVTKWLKKEGNDMKMNLLVVWKRAREAVLGEAFKIEN